MTKILATAMTWTVASVLSAMVTSFAIDSTVTLFNTVSDRIVAATDHQGDR